MNELQFQSRCIRAVREHGGAAHKLSNRFMVGVSDLLVKLPNCAAMLVEVKLAKFKTTQERTFRLQVTKPQEVFLASYDRAGMLCAVLSVIQYAPRVIHAACFQLDAVRAKEYTVSTSDHSLLKDDNALILLLECFAIAGEAATCIKP